MAEKFKTGDRVRLSIAYLDTASKEVRREFDGVLTVEAIANGMARLFNGKRSGFNHLNNVSVRYIQ